MAQDISDSTLQRLQDRAARSGSTVDNLVNRLLDAVPEDDLPPTLYRRLLEHTQDTISVFDPDLRYVYVNPVMGYLTGFDTTDMIGKSDRDLGLPPELVDGLAAVWQGVVETRQERVITFDYPTPDGQRFFESRLTPIENENGAIDYLLSITRDVTDRVRSENQLLLHSAILDNTYNGIHLVRVSDRKLLYTNPTMERMFGYKPGEMLGQHVRILNAADVEDPDEKARQIVQTLGETGAWQGEILNVRKDGTTFWSRAQVTTFDHADYGPVWVSVHEDITERKKAEDALRESEAQYRLIAENTSDGIMIFDARLQCITYASPAYQRMIADDAEIAFGKTTDDIYALIHPDDRDAIYAEIYQALDDHADSLTYTFRARRADGSYYWREDHARFVYAPDGTYLRAYVIARDITERKQMEDTLRESEEKYRLIAENTSDGISMLDTAEQRVVYVSPGYARMTGWSVEELLTHDIPRIFELMHPDDRQRIEECINRAIQRQDAELTYIYRTRHADNRYHWHEDHARLNYDPDGNIINAYVIARDITGRKQAEEALRESERTLATLMDNLPGLAYRCLNTPQWPMIVISSGCLALTGYPADAFLGDEAMSLSDIIHPDDRDRVYRAVQMALVQCEPFEVEYRITTAEGAEKHVWERGRGVFRDGVLQFLEGFITDITERKRAAEALARSENRLRSIVETQTAFVVRTDMHGNYTYVNQAFFERYRWQYGRLEDMLGASGLTTIIPEDWEKTRETVETCVANPGMPVQVVLRKPLADGGYFWTLWEFVGLTSESGLEQEVQCVGIDITELMEARQKLHLQEKALLAAANAIVITDRDASIQWVNPAFTALTGYTFEEAIGRNPNVLVKSGLHDEAFYARMWNAILAGEVWFGRLINRRKDGTLYTEEQTITPIVNDEGEISSFIAIKQDVSERLRHEAFALENERLKLRVRQEKEQNMLVQQMVSALAHDLRTPLTVIATSKDILTRYSDRLNPVQRQEKLDAIERQLQFVLELLDDVVMVVRGNLNDRDLHPTLVNLPALCQAIVDEVTEAQAAPHRVYFSNPGRIEMVSVDEILVSRILLNLLSNAIKYTPENGEIHLQLDTHETGIVLRVADSGVGISAKDLPRIFEPFYRVKNSRDIEGHGLGLSIVKDCVDRHHGQVTVESQPGKGTTFIVELPTGESIAAQKIKRQLE